MDVQKGFVLSSGKIISPSFFHDFTIFGRFSFRKSCHMLSKSLMLAPVIVYLKMEV